MEIKEGMYIRFKRYTGVVSIGQIFDVDIDKYNFCLSIDLGNSRLLFFDKENIVKYSFSLINLIEVGDYVNGVEVEEINDKEIMLVDTHLWIDKEVANRLIESIVTKEQFESMKYIVERNK